MNDVVYIIIITVLICILLYLFPYANEHIRKINEDKARIEKKYYERKEKVARTYIDSNKELIDDIKNKIKETEELFE